MNEQIHSRTQLPINKPVVTAVHVAEPISLAEFESKVGTKVDAKTSSKKQKIDR